MSDKKDNISKLGLDTSASKEKLKISKALSDARDVLPILLEGLELSAQLKKEQYDHYIKVGFSEQQALELIK